MQMIFKLKNRVEKRYILIMRSLADFKEAYDFVNYYLVTKQNAIRDQIWTIKTYSTKLKLRLIKINVSIETSWS